MRVSLNTDIGEGFGAWRIADDDTLLKLVTDANVACGFHASDPDIIRRTCEIAAAGGVGVGAQFGFRDLIGFGRRFIEIPPATLTNDVIYQIGAVRTFADITGAGFRYVKVHGALYHACVAHPSYAKAVIAGIMQAAPSIPLLCQPGTTFSAAAKAAGLDTVAEGYIDRAYRPDGLLVPRGEPGAVVTDLDDAAARAVQMATRGTVTAIDGTTIDMPVESLCIHSDSPGAPEAAAAVRAALLDAGVDVRPIGVP